MRSLILCAVLLAACGGTSPTAPVKPAGIDPSILLVSQTDDSVWVTWASDSGTVTIIVPPGATVCTRWTQAFDSLSFYIRDSVPGQPPRSTLQSGDRAPASPWVQFADYPYWAFQVDTAFHTTAGPATGYHINNHVINAEC